VRKQGYAGSWLVSVERTRRSIRSEVGGVYDTQSDVKGKGEGLSSRGDADGQEGTKETRSGPCEVMKRSFSAFFWR
jgi:hypothetical protein